MCVCVCVCVCGYLHLVHFTLFGKSSWLMHVDLRPHIFKMHI